MRALRLLLVGFVAAVSLGGCTPVHAPTGERGRSELGRGSLFHAGWTWTDEQGRAVTFAQWRGTPIVVATIYTTCVRTCPGTLTDFRKLFDAFLREKREAQFLLVTLDPAVDTPARLREFKEARGLPEPWRLLSGSAAQTRELTDLLDIHVMDIDVHVLHDAKITIVDPDGGLRRSFSRGDLDGPLDPVRF